MLSPLARQVPRLVMAPVVAEDVAEALRVMPSKS